MRPALLSAELTERLRAGGSLAVLTGAGVSAESGLATFRGPGGMWEGRDPMELATPRAFAEDPTTVWRFYAWRRAQAAAAHPNAGHAALVALEHRLAEFWLVTQNVDGLHERAGSRRVIRLHGSLWRLRCTVEATEREDLREELGPLPPRCACGALLRPGVVWFGEALPETELAEAERAVRRCSTLIVAGTSSMVYPAAALPQLARSAGAYVVEINPRRTPLTPHVDAWLEGPSGALLPAVAAAAGAALGERG